MLLIKALVREIMLKIADIDLVRGDNTLDMAMTPIAPPSPFTGYAWAYSDFNPLWFNYCIDRLNEICPNPATPVIDPSLEEVGIAVSDQNNVFYYHYTHGLAGLFVTYGGYTTYVRCSRIREWMRNRPPFKFVFLSSCHSNEKDLSGDSLSAAFTKDFSDFKSMAIACPGSTVTEALCYTRFFTLLADPANINIPLYQLFLDCDWENRSEWEPPPISNAVLNNAQFLGSHTITPKEIFR